MRQGLALYVEGRPRHPKSPSLQTGSHTLPGLCPKDTFQTHQPRDRGRKSGSEPRERDGDGRHIALFLASPAFYCANV